MRSVAFQGRDNQGVYPQNIDPNNDKRPYSEVENDGTLKGAALTSSHIFLFEQDTAVGDFNVTPSIDGEGGFNGLTENCTEIEYV